VFELTGYRQAQRVVIPGVPCSSSFSDGRNPFMSRELLLERTCHPPTLFD
jgi:hypothetical protein